MFVALRDLRFARGRFALMGAVVVLLSLLVVLLSGLTAGLGRGNTSAVTGLPADHLVFAAPATGQSLAFTDSALAPAVVEAWRNVPGVDRVEPIGVTMGRATTTERSAGVAVFAVPVGSPLMPAVAAGGVVLGTDTAAELGVAPGDPVGVAGRSLVVAAVTGDAAFSHAPVAWVSPADQPTPGAVSVLALTTDGADLAAADARLGTRTVTIDDALPAIGSYASENSSLQLMRLLLFAISALVTGAFFTVWTMQRTGDIAVLKAVGASTAYLVRDALAQALIVLVAGTSVGTALAAAIGAAAGATVPFVLDATATLVPAAAMVLLGLLGAAVALRRVTTVDPLTALGSAR